MEERGAYYVLTGGRNSGKTLVCNGLAAAARARDMDVAGLLTGPSGPEPHAPREVIDLRTGSSRRFGEPVEAGNEPGPPAQSGSDPLAPGWSLHTEVFEWANEVLETATPCDLFIIDEIGRLELVGGRGWAVALDVLRAGDYGAALVVCRPSLLETLEMSLNGPPAASFEADSENSYALPDVILEEMFG